MATNKVYNGTEWGITFDIKSPIAIDSRLVCNNFAEMHSTARWNEGTAEKPSYSVYPGMPSASLADGHIYLYIGEKGNATDIADADKWVKQINILDLNAANSSAIRFKGSVDSLTTLNAKTNPAIGDMWNMNQKYKAAGIQNKRNVSEGDTFTADVYKGGSTSETEAKTLTVRSFVCNNVVYLVCVDEDDNCVLGAGGSGWYTSGYKFSTLNPSSLVSNGSPTNGVVEATLEGDARIQGMNYACVNRYTIFKTKVYEGDTYTGKNASNNTITGEVYFHDGYAYVKATSGTTVTTYYYNRTDDVLVSFSDYGNDYATTPVYGEWDAMGSTMLNVPTKDELTGGTIVPAKASQLNTARKIEGESFDGTADINHKREAVLKSGFVGGYSKQYYLIAGAYKAPTAGDRYFVKFDTLCPTALTEPGLVFDIGTTSTVSSNIHKKLTYNGQPFTSWEVGPYYQFLFDGTNWELVGGAGSGISDEQSNILDQFAEVKVDDDTISGITKPYDMDICPSSNLIFTDNTVSNNAYVLYKQMYADLTSATQRPKLKFLLFNGQKSKFDIDDYKENTLTITFSFVNQGKFFRATLQRTDANATSAKINWVCYNADLASVLSVATIVASQQQSIAALDERTTWYKLS